MNTSNKIASLEPVFIYPGTQALVDDGYFDDAEELQRWLNKTLGGKPARKKKTKKK